MAHVYLLHFDKKVAGHAGHYCGYTPNGVQKRLDQHLAGNGARLVQAAVTIGSRVTIAEEWHHDDPYAAREQERKMKRSHNLPRYCRLCGSRRWNYKTGGNLHDRKGENHLQV